MRKEAERNWPASRSSVRKEAERTWPAEPKLGA
jgi:hypothetical protein